MKISELIERLEELRKEHGELEVYHSGLGTSEMDPVVSADLRVDGDFIELQ